MTTVGVIHPAACSGPASLAADAAVHARAGGVSLYVHVPFCASKCGYCDFYSLPLGAVGGDAECAGAVGGYLTGISRAMRVASPGLTDVPSLYVGGGTPTVLGERLVELVARVREHAKLRADAEVTVEANPDSVTPALMEALAGAGVTRVSLGVQSFDDAVLATLGRAHDARAVDAAAAAVLGSGLRLSIDLMCGVPGQTEASWRDSVHRAVATGAEHASVYPLALEAGTPLAGAVDGGLLAAPDPDVAATMMLVAEEILGEAGLGRYEVANYARNGCEALHNLRYWTAEEYLGVGPGAASMTTPQALDRFAPLGSATLEKIGVPADAAGRVRFHANATLEDFSAAGWDRAALEAEYLTPAEAAREDVMLGLRLTHGVADESVSRAGAAALEALRRLADQDLVERERGRWRATRRGWLLGNEVFGAVWSASD